MAGYNRYYTEGYNHYYVNDNPQADNGNHEVHIGTCLWLTLVTSKTYLGYLTNCNDAIAKARTIYDRVDGCAYCCKDIVSHK